ncbi:3-deoxy-8-phosphooctulonate synthase [Cytobacillus firmus]|uniref:3-deoxy-8-phosphooctulonate synthase n=1 Tax=Cytobacillus TaxID=2675230 RepID=UPI00203A76C0|nr:3-deoxy-8-phosphooctulonate synthase [Cytobacillus oceanisediminis]MCM3242649.1 3-deoxy-8-phosphooctulonate synthase [Cytobacillus oceanisediminis]MCS0822737.1 3-deoxy-8-phosphooctulonate synthase [Cytobacillus firmus]
MKTSMWNRIRQMFGSRVYHSHDPFWETETDEFIYGEITDHFDFDEEEGGTFGDGFVQAPNGSRAGLIWAVSEKPYLKTYIEPEDDRWGVYHVGFVKPIKTTDDLIFNFKTVLPMIKEAYNEAGRRK